MRAIYTEMVISQSPASEPSSGTVFDPDAIVVRVEDEAAGPFLLIHGRMSERYEGMPEGAFALDGREIDQFAVFCKTLLKQAEG